MSAPRLRDRDRSPVSAFACRWSYVASPGAREKDFVSWGACLGDMEGAMELRHLRYFIAVAEEGSLTLAAEKTAAHGAAVPQPPNPRSGIRGRRPAYEAQRARHRTDRRRAGLSRSCAAGAHSGRGGRTGSAASRATRQTYLRYGFPNRAGGRLAAACHQHPSRRIAQHRNQSFERPFHNARRRPPARKTRYRFSPPGAKPDLEYQIGRKGAAGRDPAERSSARCSATPSIRTISWVKHSSGYQACRACCVLLSPTI